MQFIIVTRRDVAGVEIMLPVDKISSIAFIKDLSTDQNFSIISMTNREAFQVVETREQLEEMLSAK